MTSSRASVTRRKFLGIAAKSSWLFGLGGFVTLSKRNDFLRPPGAAINPDFVSLCMKCQRCQHICETGVIFPVLLTESIESAGTPKLDLRVSYCSLCMKCVEVCPTGALLPVSAEEARLGVARIDPARCIAWKWKGCTLCQAECPTEAIVLDEAGRPTVDESLCTGCGRCEYVCIAGKARSYAGSEGKGIVVIPLDAAEARLPT